jgi:low affinity Fe/Cu permease
MGSAKAFAAACFIVIAWFVVSAVFFQFSELSQLFINTLTTIITFLMVFLIQHTNDIDTKALHTKLDELIRIHSEANNELIEIERRS